MRVRWLPSIPLLLVFGLGCGAAPDESDADDEWVDEIEEAVVAGAIDAAAELTDVQRINTRRVNHDKKKVFRSLCLTKAARGWSKKMAADDDLSHSNLGKRVTSFCGSGWTLLGENVGVGGSEHQIWQALLDSPPHRANIDNGKFGFVGVGVFEEDGGQVWMTQLFARCVKPDGSRCGGKWDDPVP